MMRYWLLSLPRARRVYLHVYRGSDSFRDPHDHPKGFLSIGLWGGYVEARSEFFWRPGEPACPVQDWRHVAWRNGRRRVRRVRLKQLRAPWIRVFSADYTHRLRIPRGRLCITLCITGPETQEWGFYAGGWNWVPWRAYLRERLRAAGRFALHSTIVNRAGRSRPSRPG